MGRVCMGRVGYGPSLSWAKFVMGRDVQLPPQSMFKSKNKKKNEYPCKPQLFYIKMGCKGVYISRICYPDVLSKASLGLTWCLNPEDRFSRDEAQITLINSEFIRLL